MKKILFTTLIIIVLMIWYLNVNIVRSFFLIVVMLLILVALRRLTPKILFAISVVLLVLVPILLYMQETVLADKIMKLSYIVLVAGLLSEPINNYSLIKIRDFLFSFLTFSIGKRYIGSLITFIKNLIKKINIMETLISKKNYNKILPPIIILGIFNSYNCIKQYFYFKNLLQYGYVEYYLGHLLIYQLLITLILILLLIYLIKSKILKIKFYFVIFCLYGVFMMLVFNYVSHKIDGNPTITAVNRHAASMWSYVHVYGINFGNAQYNGASVYIGDQPHRVMLWTDKKVIFVVDPFKSINGKIWIKNVDQKTSNKIRFKYIPI